MVPRIREAATWPQRNAPTRQSVLRRFGRSFAIGVAALAALLVMSAWAVPPMLDWGRFRSAIAAIVGAQLGRTVVIGGDVALRLFPEAVLTASDVTLPEQGDGMSARIANLRLEVSLGPLLAGRLVVRDLVLGSPVVTLPWPLPGSLVNPVRPRVPHPFAAHVENGVLQVGLAAVTGINAAIHGGPGTEPAAGQIPEALPLAVFGAEGFAAFDGQKWRFTTALGAPDADGVSAVDLAMKGQGPAHDTGGSLQGTLSEGILQGHLHAAGPNLALIMPSSPLSWQADAPFVANGERIVSSSLRMSLGGAPASATIALQLAAPSRLDVRLNASTLDLDGWARLLNGTFAGFDLPSIPVRLDLAADRGSLLGGELAGISGVLSLEGGHATLDHVKVLLPGNAKLDFAGKIARGPHALLTVEGPASLDAPDLHATLAWLRPLAPPLLDAIPGGVLRNAHLAGQMRLTPGAFSATSLTGHVDGVPTQGGVDLAFGDHPNVAATLSFDRLSIDDWLAGQGLDGGRSLAESAKSFASVEATLHLHAGSASWNGQDLHDVVLDAASGAAGLKIEHAAAVLAGADLDLSGMLGPDGTLADIRGHAAVKDAAALFARLPAAWRWLPGLWQGDANFAFSADGPPQALSLQLRVGTGDLVAEAEQVRNTLSGGADTTLTFRHPGAPRLLSLLGVPGAEHFLETGSLAFLAHLHSAADAVSVQDFSLDAASMHLDGHGTLDFTASEPALDFDVSASLLALPDLALLRTAWLQQARFRGSLRLSAQDVAVGGVMAAHGLEANLAAGAGVILADRVKIDVAGGHFAGQAAIDSSQEQPVLALRGNLANADLSALLPARSFGFDSGKADFDLDVSTAGQSEAAVLGHLKGDAGVTLHDAHVTGFDLGRLDALLTARVKPPRAALMQALSQGGSGGFSGSATARLDHGKLALADSSVSSADGVVSATGAFDLQTGQIDVLLGLVPAVSNPPHYTLKLSGTDHDLKSQPDLGKPVSLSRRSHK